MSARGWMVLAFGGFWMGLLGALIASAPLAVLGVAGCAGCLLSSYLEWQRRK